MRLAEKQKVFPAARQSTYYSLKDLISKLPASTICLLPLWKSNVTGRLRGPCWVIVSQRAEIYLPNSYLQKGKSYTTLHYAGRTRQGDRSHGDGLRTVVVLCIHQPRPHLILLEGNEEQCHTDQCIRSSWICGSETPSSKELPKWKGNLLFPE